VKSVHLSISDITDDKERADMAMFTHDLDHVTLLDFQLFGVGPSPQARGWQWGGGRWWQW